MLLLIECMVVCTFFAGIVLIAQYKDPVKYIMSYPPEIRKRVASLPQYKNSIESTKTRHILKKIVAILMCIALFTIIAYFSGANTFQKAFLHVFVLFLSINLFDVIVLDIGVFCHSKKLRIPGTEDMDKEYKDYLFHIKGGIKGVIFGVVISFISSCIIHVVSAI